MSNELDLERLSEGIKHSLQENSVVIFRVPVSEVAKVSLSLKAFDEMFKRHNISALVCPDDIEVIIVPPDSKLKVEPRLDA